MRASLHSHPCVPDIVCTDYHLRGEQRMCEACEAEAERDAAEQVTA